MTENQKKVAAGIIRSMSPEDQKKVYPVSRSVKRLFTERENELYLLIRKRGLTVSQIIERSNPTLEEIVWMWDLDRQDLMEIRKK